jgi:asparagine synthetase B (glutamine-hydrolysing)
MSFEPKLSAVGYYGLQPSTPLLFGSRSPPDIDTGYQSCRSLALWTTATTATNHGVFAAVVGTILNLHELALPISSNRCTKQLAQPPSGAALVATLYRTFGLSSLKKIRGFFAIILYDTDTDTVYILTDHICSTPIFYVVSPDYLLFSTSLRSLQQYAPLPLAPNLPTIACYLAGFLPAEATFLLDVRRVPRNSVLEVTAIPGLP